MATLQLRYDLQGPDLAGAIDQLSAGRGGTMFVAGPDGAARRLWRRLAAEATERGALVLVGHTPVASACADYGPVAEAISSAGRGRGAAALPEAGGPLAGLVLDAGVGGDVPQPALPVVSEAVLRTLGGLAARSAVVVVMEGMHRADGKSLAVVEYLQANIEGLPILLVCTFDPRRAGPVLVFAEEAEAQETAVLVRVGPGGEPAAGARADGFDGLTEACRRALHVVAVVGTASDAEVVARASGLSDAASYQALREARSAGWLVETTARVPDLVLPSEAAAQAVLDDMLPEERVTVAEQARGAIEACHPERSAAWSERAARVCLFAGHDAPAQRHLLDAAATAAATGELAAAERLLSEARRLAPASAEPSVELLEVELAVELAAGRTMRAIAAGEAVVAALTGREGCEARLATAQVQLATARHQAGQVGEPAPAGLAGAADTTTMLQLRTDLLDAECRAWRAETAAAAETAQRVAAAAAGVDPILEHDALELLGRALVSADGREAVAAFEQARRVAQRAGLRIAAAQARVRGASLQAVATLDVRELAAAHAAALATASPGLAAEAEFRMGVVLSVLDRAAEATAHLERALQEARAEGGWYVPAALSFLAGCHARAGRRDAADELLREAEAVGGDRPDSVAAVFGEGRAMAALAAGAFASARGDLVVAARAAASSQPLCWSFLGLHRLMDAAADGSTTGAPAPTAPWTRTYRGHDAMAHAVIAARRGDHGGAIAAVDDGRAYLAPAPWQHHVALLVVAPAALRQGWREAEGWLRAALAFFDATDRPPLATRCRTLLAEAGLPVPRRGRGRAEVPAALAAIGITSRELDVIELVRAGLSNGEIAEELVVSLHTVKTHLTHVFRKTGVSRRSDLADHIDAVLADAPDARAAAAR